MKLIHLSLFQIGSKLLGKAVEILANAELDSAKEIIWERPVSNDDGDDSGDRHLFNGLSFRIVVSEEEIRDKLFSDIGSHGGNNVFVQIACSQFKHNYKGYPR